MITQVPIADMEACIAKDIARNNWLEEKSAHVLLCRVCHSPFNPTRRQLQNKKGPMMSGICSDKCLKSDVPKYTNTNTNWDEVEVPVEPEANLTPEQLGADI